jgi:hypothetical protein
MKMSQRNSLCSYLKKQKCLLLYIKMEYRRANQAWSRRLASVEECEERV